MSENLPHRQTVAAPPMQAAEWEGELPLRLHAAFPSVDISCRTYLGQNFIEVPLAAGLDVLSYLKQQEQFDTLTDLTAVDHPGDEQRFEIIYILYSFSRNERVRMKTRAPVDADVPSAVSHYPGANWMEREVFDMFGVHFTGHPDLKRILMPDEWEGFPLRKDMSIVAMDNDWVRQNLGIESGQ
jgi:NADH-quinone oxidoreductase subunit C